MENMIQKELQLGLGVKLRAGATLLLSVHQLCKRMWQVAAGSSNRQWLTPETRYGGLLSNFTPDPEKYPKPLLLSFSQYLCLSFCLSLYLSVCL